MTAVNVVRAVLLCVAGALVCGVLRVQRPEMKMAVVIAVGLAALAFSLSGIGESVETLRTLADSAGFKEESTLRLIRAVGVALLCEFGAQLCRDAEETALAGRVELVGRVALLGMTAPMLAGLTRQLMTLLP